MAQVNIHPGEIHVWLRRGATSHGWGMMMYRLRQLIAEKLDARVIALDASGPMEEGNAASVAEE